MALKNSIKITILAVLTILVISSLVTAQGSVVLDHVDGDWPPSSDTLLPVAGIRFHLRLDNTSPYHIIGITNGFRLYSPDGAHHEIDPSETEWNPSIDWSLYFDGGRFTNFFSGPGADTVGFGSFRIFSEGYPPGSSHIAYTITTSLDWTDDGKTLCLDTAYYQPLGNWLWSTSGPTIAPEWLGPFCWDIAENPCKKTPPYIVNCPGALVGDHCAMMVFDFDVQDRDAGGTTPIFSLLSGPGTLDSVTGVWSYQPSLADVGVALSLLVEISDAICGASTCGVDLTFTNSAPQLTEGCYSYVPLYGPTATVQMGADPVDCDPNIYQIESISPSTNGISIDSSSGLLTCIGDSIIPDTLYKVAVAASDGFFTSDTCWVWFVRATCQLPGNMNHIGEVDISDMVYLVGYLFDGGYPPPSFEEGDVNGSGFIDISDLTYFVDYLFVGGPPPVSCP